jgi:tripartite-type tricarboxylate transporter receptor subunit TctC
VSAQPQPNRPLRLIVPFSPGGPADILARTLSARLGPAIQQQIVVDARPGAGGNVGAEIAATAPGDGNTLLMIATAHAINSALQQKATYKLLDDFVAVTPVGASPHVLLVYPGVPASNPKELMQFLKTNSAKFNIASSGNGTPGHFAADLFQRMAGVELVHVPYRGGAPAAVDLMAGHVQLFFDNIASALPHVKAGKARPLAVTSARRSNVLPDVPTLDESGLKGFEITSWFGIVAPRGTPDRMRTNLNAAIGTILSGRDVREHLARQGAEPIIASPDEFKAFLASEVSKWRKLVISSGIKVD